MDEDRLANIAVELARRVREADVDDNGDWLVSTTDAAERWGLLFVLAAGCRPEVFHYTTRFARRRAEKVVDEIAVDLACAGERVNLTRDERRVVAQTLIGRGYSDGETARRAGLSRRQVSRIRHGEAQWTWEAS